MGSALEGLRLHARKSCPASLLDRESAKKFAPRAHNTPNSAFLCLLGEYFAEVPLWGPCWASFFAPTDIVPALVGDTAPYKSEVVGVLHYMKPSYSVSPACRTLMSCNSPRCSVPHPVLCVHGVCLVC